MEHSIVPIHVESRAGSAPPNLYRRLIDSLTDYAIFALTIDGRIASWNAGAERIFEYTEAEVLGQRYHLLFTADDIASEVPEKELHAARTFGKAAVDGWHVRKDGSRLWCTNTVQTWHDPTGTVAGFSKIVRDSTESHESQEHLRASEERLRLLIEGVTNYALFSLDTGGRIVSWNSGAEHVFGYREGEAIGKHFSLVYTDEAIAAGIPESEILEATRSGRAADEGWHVRRSGDLFYASGQMTRLKPGDDGAPRGFVKIAHDITAGNSAREALKQQAFRDDLTSLPNRTSFSECLRLTIAHARLFPEAAYAVIFIDLDHFKTINDSLGHGHGDLLLAHVARLLEHIVRPQDFVARLGGDEFTILLTEIKGVSDALRVAERVHAGLNEPIYLDGLEVFTTASMGIALGPAHYAKPEEVLRDADTAMYEAKARGRSRHVLFDGDMHARAVGLLELQMDLRRASVRDDFAIAYQPIVSLLTGRTTGFEALVRWNHPRRGTLPPSSFIAEAENIGLIIAIDRWVLHQACRQLHAWHAESGDTTLTMSVNLSSKQFAHDGLLDEVRNALKRSDLPVHCLKLEITETALMEWSETAAATIEQLTALGVQLYIDDFGTGYSSLSCLTRFSLGLLKVDRSFVSQISSDPRGVEVAGTIVTLAHNLGLKALAEGVETQEQLSALRALGCELGQGFWFSPPVAPEIAQSYIGRCLPIG